MHGATIDDARTARLPEGDQRAIGSAQQNVDVAHANLAAAKVARDEAKQFQKIASRELVAAKSRLAASGTDLSQREVLAARAKQDYADRLVDLRDAQLDEQQAMVELARADREWTKYEALERNDM